MEYVLHQIRPRLAHVTLHASKLDCIAALAQQWLASTESSVGPNVGCRELCAVVDMIVCRRARHFTGFWPSTFSQAIGEYRKYHNKQMGHDLVHVTWLYASDQAIWTNISL